MFPISDLPPEIPVQEIRVYCSVEAAIHYAMPADLIYAVALAEGGGADSKIRNSNGTYDLGFMQFNTAYLKTLKSDGIYREDVLKNNCYPFHLAAWRIKNHLLEKDSSDKLKKVAYYHSRTEKFNKIYRQKLAKNVNCFPFEKAEKYFFIIINNLKKMYIKKDK